MNNTAILLTYLLISPLLLAADNEISDEELELKNRGFIPNYCDYDGLSDSCVQTDIQTIKTPGSNSIIQTSGYFDLEGYSTYLYYEFTKIEFFLTVTNFKNFTYTLFDQGFHSTGETTEYRIDSQYSNNKKEIIWSSTNTSFINVNPTAGSKYVLKDYIHLDFYYGVRVTNYIETDGWQLRSAVYINHFFNIPEKKTAALHLEFTSILFILVIRSILNKSRRLSI